MNMQGGPKEPCGILPKLKLQNRPLFRAEKYSEAARLGPRDPSLPIFELPTYAHAVC